MSTSPPKDPRIEETLKHLRLLAKKHDRPLVVQDYLEYRAVHAPRLPSLTTIYRLFETWPAVLAAAGIAQSERSPLSRTPDERLIAALQQAARELGVESLSSHLYDEYRAVHAPELPSSSVIRKWLGPWGSAVEKAGLKTSERSLPRRPTLQEIIEALRDAKERVEGMLTPRTYGELVASLPEQERKRWPDISQIYAQFPHWDAALRAADVEQSDVVHPKALWTAEEARRIAQMIERLTGEPLSEHIYKDAISKAARPLPSWQVMVDLLSGV